MGNYAVVPLPLAKVDKPKHWMVGKEVSQSEINSVWKAAEVCDEKLTDYCDNLKQTMEMFSELELILFDGKNEFVADRFMEIANMVDTYYEGRMEWITATLKAAATAFDSYKEANSEGCDAYDEYVYDVDDDGNQYLVAIHHWHTCSCSGKREAGNCSLCQ